MNSFDFVTSPRILFGVGCLADGIKAAAQFGRKALLVHATSGATLDPIISTLKAEGIKFVEFSVDHEPSVGVVQEMVELARSAGCDFVLAYGGGSVMDAGKATAAMLTNPGDLLDYLEVVGQNKPLTRPAAPCVAVPTTAGTGAEVTRNAVLAVPEKKVKVSLRSNYLLPRLAVVDPQLTVSLPAQVTAYTGLDALTQVIEPYVSIKSNPLVDVICRDGMARSVRSLRKAYSTGADLDARLDLNLTSLYGGLALTNAGLGAVHGFAAPMGGMFDIHHGAVCGILLPAVVRMNITALMERSADNQALLRYVEIARLLTGNPDARARDGADWLAELVSVLKIPRLSDYKIPREDFSSIVEKAQKASSMKANPIMLTAEELTAILDESY
ncbi:MAG: iron-containing alcohol dehydrogenase [Leptolinea sp.]|jgi:alcohol dehydrogenase class IV|nr:iron-containing alcohol dehydrogenase [Leptolinea sp.]